MKFNTKLFTTLVVFGSLGSTEPALGEESKPLIPICPILSEDNLQTLAKDGSVHLDGITYKLVTHEETHNNYKGLLIETKDDLGVLFNKSPNKPTVTRDINSHQNAMMRDHQKPYCAYALEGGSDGHITEEHVIALMPSSDISQK